METLKNIKLDVDRIILQLLIPGAFSVVPFFLLFINSYEGAQKYFMESEGLCSTALFILALAFGLILEDVGSWIEYEIDKKNQVKYLKEHKRDIEKEWEKYLQLELSSNCDIVAQRYLRTILIRMKFELSFLVSLLVMIIGLIFLNLKINFVDSWFKFILICVFVPFIICCYLLWEVRDSSRLMIKIRKLILDKSNKNMPISTVQNTLDSECL